MFKKTVWLIMAVFLIFPRLVRAEEEVKTMMDVVYEVNEEGKTRATFEITLENLVTERYAKSFEMVFEGGSLENIEAREGREELEVRANQDGEKTRVEIEFDEAVVGKGKRREIIFSFEDSSYAARAGDVWELDLPMIREIEKHDEVNVELRVARQLGMPAYVAPEPLGAIESGRSYIFYFNKERLVGGGISVVFGEFQVYAFSLVYHLENPIKKDLEIEIAIPPDSAFQRVIYEQIVPKPENVVIDEDGNWLAKYTLKGRERLDVKTSGKVQIFAEPRKLTEVSDEILELNKKASDYWQIDEAKIKQLGQELGNPKRIYDWVVENLDYDYERVKPNAKRLGASEALNRSDEAMCMEFSDVFIALCRAAGIPAREVNGYAYTENPKLQPLSLVADVLHSWPEYWDEEQGVWEPVDPTWAKTTGGEDFFGRHDLRHFTFVIHGVDAEKPYSPGSYKLGANPQKDVYVSFSSLPEVRKAKAELVVEKHSIMAVWDLKYEVKIINPGPTGLYNLKVETFFDEEKVGKEEIGAIAPYGWETIEVGVESGFLGLGLPKTVKFRVDGKEAVLATNKNVIILALLTAVLFLLLVAVVILIRLMRARK